MCARYLVCVKHHYVPQFLLRRWTSAAGKLRVFAIRNGQLVCSERAPEYTGYENGLYAVMANVFGFSQDVIERKLFGPIDNDAAKVLEKLERHETITEVEHIAWTFFLNSLRIRQPDTLEYLRTDGMNQLKRILSEQDKATLPPDSPTTEQWFNRYFPGAMEAKSLASWLPRLIAHDDVTRTFSELKWWIREFAPTEIQLLLSDLPIHWEGGFNEAEFMIHLPIAPNRIIFGTRSKQTELILKQMPAADLIGRVNLTTLASSSQRIWASTQDEAQAFIEANVGSIGTNVIRFDLLAL